MTGKIVKGIAGFYYVHVANMGTYECKAKGVFRKNNEKPLVGDNCEIDILDEDKKLGNICRICERKNSLIRPNVANVDQALVIFASVKPTPNFNLLDRFLIMMQQNDIPCILCFNKKDLAEDEKLSEIEKIYENAGYPVLFTSATDNDGIDDIRKIIAGKTTTVAGPSGVGKSTIINLLAPNAQMETGSISEKIDRGKHTTRHSEFIAVGDDTYILDTPGFSSLGLFDMTRENLRFYYPEFEKYSVNCRFDDCVHRNEPSCGVIEALESGLINPVRYENYLQLLDECENKRKF